MKYKITIETTEKSYPFINQIWKGGLTEIKNRAKNVSKNGLFIEKEDCIDYIPYHSITRIIIRNYE